MNFFLCFGRFPRMTVCTFQSRRMLVLRRLLSSYPFKKSLLFCECCHDIPPLYRANLWSALLNIYWDVEKRFMAVDTLSPHASDRQLLVDIPRCHQVIIAENN